MLEAGVAYRRRRGAGDLYGRSLVGPIFYAIGCIVSAWVSGYLSPLHVLGWLPALAYVAMFFLRRFNRPPVSFADPTHFDRWRRRHWFVIHAGSLVWSIVATYFCYLDQGSEIAFITVLVITVMLGTALSMAFSLDAKQTALTLFLLYAPLFGLFLVEPKLRLIAVTISIFVVYQVSVMRRLALEYDAQVATEYALLVSRAEIERMMRVDVLTGLANRREYEIIFPKAWHQAARTTGAIAVLVCDLDHFKKINDTHGHLAGDACLQHFARLVQTCFRADVDVLARIGGEEFVVVMPGVALGEAQHSAERLREMLEATPCAWHSEALPMTVSIGVGSAEWSKDTTPESTIARVDSACYRAKTSGRNRVVVA